MYIHHISVRMYGAKFPGKSWLVIVSLAYPNQSIIICTVHISANE